MAINSFRDLLVWQAGMELVERVYQLAQSFPTRESYGLTVGMRRAAVSIPRNIAEGHTRRRAEEYLQHLSLAQASLAELQTQIETAGRLRYLPPRTVAETLDQSAALSRQLYTLRKSIAEGGRA